MGVGWGRFGSLHPIRQLSPQYIRAICLAIIATLRKQHLLIWCPTLSAWSHKRKSTLSEFNEINRSPLFHAKKCARTIFVAPLRYARHSRHLKWLLVESDWKKNANRVSFCCHYLVGTHILFLTSLKAMRESETCWQCTEKLHVANYWPKVQSFESIIVIIWLRFWDRRSWHESRIYE